VEVRKFSAPNGFRGGCHDQFEREGISLSATLPASSFDHALALRLREIQSKCWLRLLLDLSRNVLGEYPDSSAFDRGRGVEQVGCDLLDRVSMGQELRLPGGTQGALHPGEFVHRGVTDLTFNRFAVVQHRKPKRQSFEVVSQDFASRQWHLNIPQRFV
jgi:hypothetical protein